MSKSKKLKWWLVFCVFIFSHFQKMIIKRTRERSTCLEPICKVTLKCWKMVCGRTKQLYASLFKLPTIFIKIPGKIASCLFAPCSLESDGEVCQYFSFDGTIIWWVCNLKEDKFFPNLGIGFMLKVRWPALSFSKRFFLFNILRISYINNPYLLRLIAFDQLLILKIEKFYYPLNYFFNFDFPIKPKQNEKNYDLFMNDERKLWHLNFERNWPHIWQHPSFISEKNSMSYWYWFDSLFFWQW